MLLEVQDLAPLYFFKFSFDLNFLGNITAMLEQSPSMTASSYTSDNRSFVYEVEGLCQNDRTSNNSYQIRSSGNVFIPVTYSRMNSEMQRITRLGGKIVNIIPVADAIKSKPAPAASKSADKE
jgi:CpcD/allophycocyanin linker domain